MVAAADNREDAGGVDVRDRLRHLIERLFDVAGDHEDVADIAEIELLVEVDGAIDGVAVIERGDGPHRGRRSGVYC